LLVSYLDYILGCSFAIRYVPWFEGSGWDGSLFTEADVVGSGIINFLVGCTIWVQSDKSAVLTLVVNVMILVKRNIFIFANYRERGLKPERLH
jgi:endoglucanase Acf2